MITKECGHCGLDSYKEHMIEMNVSTSQVMFEISLGGINPGPFWICASCFIDMYCFDISKWEKECDF